MDPTYQELQERYASLPTDQLIQFLKLGELTEAAKSIIECELLKRGVPPKEVKAAEVFRSANPKKRHVEFSPDNLRRVGARLHFYVWFTAMIVALLFLLTVYANDPLS